MYDIKAKVSDSIVNGEWKKLPFAQRWNEVMLMPRSLLINRFKLRVGNETKVLAVFEMVLAENGPTIAEDILAKLRRQPGEQLVFVHYNPDHNPDDEWVYNHADLSSAKVVWADDMGPAENEKLIQYFRNRHAWLVDADDNPPKLVTYSAAADGRSEVMRRNGP